MSIVACGSKNVECYNFVQKAVIYSISCALIVIGSLGATFILPIGISVSYSMIGVGVFLTCFYTVYTYLRLKQSASLDKSNKSDPNTDVLKTSASVNLKQLYSQGEVSISKFDNLFYIPKNTAYQIALKSNFPNCTFLYGYDGGRVLVNWDFSCATQKFTQTSRMNFQDSFQGFASFENHVAVFNKDGVYFGEIFPQAYQDFCSTFQFDWVVKAIDINANYIVGCCESNIEVRCIKPKESPFELKHLGVDKAVLNNNYLVSISKDTLKVFDLEKKECLLEVDLTQLKIQNCQIQKWQQGFIIFGDTLESKEKKIFIWNPSDLKNIQSIDSLKCFETLSCYEDWIAIADTQNSISIYDDQFKLIRKIDLEINISQIYFADNYIICGGHLAKQVGASIFSPIEDKKTFPTLLDDEFVLQLIHFS